MEITNNINEIRSLAQVLSPSNFKKIIRHRDYFSTFYRIKKYTTVQESTTNLETISGIYKTLIKDYKNEYVYKNILINKLLLKKHSLKNTIALSEFNIGNSIADFVLLNGEARIYEIKTELDNLEKLEKQIEDYYKFSDKVYIVTNSKHICNLKNLYKKSNVGIIELTERNALNTIKEAVSYKSSFNFEVLFKTLRKEEYSAIINEYYGIVPDVPNTKFYRECFSLAKKIEIFKFQNLVIKKLKLRNISNPNLIIEKSIPECLKHICYTLDFSKTEYKELDYFLTKRSKVCISRI